MNESDVFEENNLYIQGLTLKNTLNYIFEEFQNIFKEIHKEDIDKSEYEDLK